MVCRNRCLAWHRSRSKLQLGNLLTSFHSLPPFCIFAWFYCVPPPAVTSRTWRNLGHCLVWLPNEWSTGTHATTQWGVLPTGQFRDSLVESSGQEWVRYLRGCCPSFWGEVGTKEILERLSYLSQQDHGTELGEESRGRRRKEEVVEEGLPPSQKWLGGSHLLYWLPAPHQALPGSKLIEKSPGFFHWHPQFGRRATCSTKHHCSWVFK